MHDRGADLDVGGTQGHELSGIPPGGDAAYGGERRIDAGVAGQCAHHVQGNGFDGRAAVAAMGAFAGHRRQGRHAVEIDADQALDGIDEGQAIRPRLHRRPSRNQNVIHIGRELDQHGHRGEIFGPSGDFSQHPRLLADGAAHAPFAHAVRAAEVQFDAVAAGILRALNEVAPFRTGLHHQARD